jgi:hypothetical protein
MIIMVVLVVVMLVVVMVMYVRVVVIRGEGRGRFTSGSSERLGVPIGLFSSGMRMIVMFVIIMLVIVIMPVAIIRMAIALVMMIVVGVVFGMLASVGRGVYRLLAEPMRMTGFAGRASEGASLVVVGVRAVAFEVLALRRRGVGALVNSLDDFALDTLAARSASGVAVAGPPPG